MSFAKMDNGGEYRRGSRGGDGYGNDSFGGKSTNAGLVRQCFFLK